MATEGTIVYISGREFHGYRNQDMILTAPPEGDTPTPTYVISQVGNPYNFEQLPANAHSVYTPFSAAIIDSASIETDIFHLGAPSTYPYYINASDPSGTISNFEWGYNPFFALPESYPPEGETRIATSMLAVRLRVQDLTIFCNVGDIITLAGEHRVIFKDAGGVEIGRIAHDFEVSYAALSSSPFFDLQSFAVNRTATNAIESPSIALERSSQEQHRTSVFGPSPSPPYRMGSTFSFDITSPDYFFKVPDRCSVEFQLDATYANRPTLGSELQEFDLAGLVYSSVYFRNIAIIEPEGSAESHDSIVPGHLIYGPYTNYGETSHESSQGVPVGSIVTAWYKDVECTPEAKNAAPWQSEDVGFWPDNGPNAAQVLAWIPQHHYSSEAPYTHGIYLVVTDKWGTQRTLLVRYSLNVFGEHLPTFQHPLGAIYALPKTSEGAQVREIYTTNTNAETLATFTGESPLGLTRDEESGDIWAGTKASGIFKVRKSEDDGRTWSETNMAAPFDTSYKFHCGPVALHGGFLGAVATKDGNIYFSRSSDGGASYTVIDPPVGAFPSSAKHLTLQPRTLHDGDTGIAISDALTPGCEFESRDIGENWQLITA